MKKSDAEALMKGMKAFCKVLRETNKEKC